MKGSDKVKMTINIGSETLILTAGFNEQDTVREAESAVKLYYNKLKRDWPDSTDRQILAMAAYQFSFWLRELQKIQEEAEKIASVQTGKIDESLTSANSTL